MYLLTSLSHSPFCLPLFLSSSVNQSWPGLSHVKKDNMVGWSLNILPVFVVGSSWLEVAIEFVHSPVAAVTFVSLVKS